MIVFLFIVNRAIEKAEENGYCLLQMISFLTRYVTLFYPILALIYWTWILPTASVSIFTVLGNNSQFLCIAQNNKE